MNATANVQSIFGQALEMATAADRAAFLDQACANDPDLRAEVDGLLRALDKAGGFLQRPAVATIDMPEKEIIGTMIGPYRLMEEIGEGGMGLVYVAEQQHPVRRKVALKVIKPGMDTREVIGRFEAERQALALMDHPNIAKVLDAGATDNGRPYFVMELVRGIPITEFCDQNQLPPRERLALFITVCRAVQHAHQKGIVHRDLKPSNILVTLHDGQPVPKVIDFGVAKAIGQRLTDRTVYTRFMQVVGTPLYMSPEQAEMSGLDIDTRTDVYSLGVLLYELLTGSTPLDRERFTNAALDEWRRIIREEDPPKPSTRLSDSADRLPAIAAQRKTEPDRLTRLVRGDLDQIVMKALEKDRNRRYESPSTFAQDIERYLADQPIEARPPSAVYRFQKFARRNRGPMVVCTLAVLLALGVGIRRFNDYRDRLASDAHASTQVSQILEQASLALGQAMASPMDRDADWAAARAGWDRIAEWLQSSNRIEDVTRARAFTFLKTYNEAFAERILAMRVEAIVIFGASNMDAKSWMNMEERLRALFREMDIDLDKLAPAQVVEKIRASKQSIRLVDALEMWLGTRGHLAMMGGPKVTHTEMKPWIEAMYAADTDPVRTGIRRLMYDQSPPQPKPEQVEAVIRGVKLETLSPRTLSWLGTVFAMAGQPERGDDIYHVALRHYPADFMTNFDYAFMLIFQKRWQESIRYYMRCVTVRPNVAGVWRCLGCALRETGEHRRSREALEQSVKLQGDHAPTHVDLAETLLALKDYDAAAESAQTALTLGGEDALAFGCLGRALMRQGKFAEALAALEKCRDGAENRPKLQSDAEEWIVECRRLMNGKSKPESATPPS